MPRTIVTSVYRFDELSDEATERARQWYVEEVLPGDGDRRESVLEDFRNICGILGLTLLPEGATGRNAAGRPSAGTQRDGACFEGSWTHAPVSSRRIREYAPRDECLHAIADTLAAAQARNGGELCASVIRNGDAEAGRSMRVGLKRDSRGAREPAGGTGRIVREELRKLARWLDAALEKEREDQGSEAVVDEVIRPNEWEFTADGAFFAPRRHAGAAGRAEHA